MLKAADAPQLLYERLADKLQGLIDKGTLRPGDKLPSVRRLSLQERVSVSTVLAAFRALELRGVLETRPQSGHYVRRVQALHMREPRSARASKRAARVSVADRVAEVYGAALDRSLVPLGVATVSPALIPTEKLARLLSSVARGAPAHAALYDFPPGCPLLRRQIARRSVTWGAPLAADELVTTVGAMEALHLALRAVTEPGDTIAVESPAFYGLLQLIESLGLKVVEIPMHARHGLDLSALEAALGAFRIRACVVTPNFNTPLGCLMPDEAKAELVRMLARREIPLIEDDVYGDLHFAPVRPKPAKAWDKHGLVLLCSSFTKTLAPGYRVGFIAPGRFQERVERLKFAHTAASPTATQLAVASFLESGGYDRHLRTLRLRLKQQVERMSEAVAAAFPADTRVSRPEGGFVLWLELPKGVDGIHVHQAALARGILTVPGTICAASQRFSNCLRISCGNPWSVEIERAVGVLGKIVHEA